MSKLPPDSPFYAWEGEGWIDDLLTLTPPKACPTKPPVPREGSLWTSRETGRRGRIGWANHSHTKIVYNENGGWKIHPTVKFLELYSPIN